MSKALAGSFEKVRRDFFPRWDRERRWSATYDMGGRGSGIEGFCDDDARLIRIRRSRRSADRLDMLLVHEVCHAVTGCCGHGSVWMKRMGKAADRARALGREALAELIDRNAQDLYETPNLTHRYLYCEIDDLVLVEGVDSFERVSELLCDQFGLNEREFSRRFKRARAVFDEAVKNRRVEEEARARFETARST